MYQKDRDALLFVKDIEKKRPEFTEQHFKDLLSDKDVEGVSKVSIKTVWDDEFDICFPALSCSPHSRPSIPFHRDLLE